MKMYVEDLRPGDVFDVVELAVRQGVSRCCITDAMRREHDVTVMSVNKMEAERVAYVMFEVGTEWHNWLLYCDQTVEVKEW